MTPQRPSTLIVGASLLAVGVLGVLDAQDVVVVVVGGGALVAILFIGLGLAGLARAVWGGTTAS